MGQGWKGGRFGPEDHSQEQRGNGPGPNPECWVTYEKRHEAIARLPWVVDGDGMELDRKVVRWPWIS